MNTLTANTYPYNFQSCINISKFLFTQISNSREPHNQHWETDAIILLTPIVYKISNLHLQQPHTLWEDPFNLFYFLADDLDERYKVLVIWPIVPLAPKKTGSNYLGKLSLRGKISKDLMRFIKCVNTIRMWVFVSIFKLFLDTTVNFSIMLLNSYLWIIAILQILYA